MGLASNSLFFSWSKCALMKGTGDRQSPRSHPACSLGSHTDHKQVKKSLLSESGRGYRGEQSSIRGQWVTKGHPGPAHPGTRRLCITELGWPRETQQLWTDMLRLDFIPGCAVNQLRFWEKSPCHH